MSEDTRFTAILIFGAAVIAIDAIMVNVGWPIGILAGIGIMALAYIGEVLFSSPG